MKLMAEEFNPSFKIAIPVQIIILFLCCLVLDSGEIFCIAFLTALGYWVGVGLIVLRRRKKAGANDFLFIQVGYLYLLVFSFLWAFFGLTVLFLIGWGNVLIRIWGK